jgi:archaellum component FlaC
MVTIVKHRTPKEIMDSKIYELESKVEELTEEVNILKSWMSTAESILDKFITNMDNHVSYKK